MLSSLKARTPTIRTTGRRIARKVRCFSAKAMIAFMVARVSAGQRSSGLGGTIDEQAPARYDFLTRFEAIENLHHAVVDTAGADLPERQVTAALHDPDPGGFAFMHDGLLGHRDCI